MKTAVPSRIHKEASTAVYTEAELENSQKRSSRLAVFLYTYRQLLGRIAAVLLGATAIVIIATIRNTPEVSVVTAVPTQTEIPQTPQAAEVEATLASKSISDPTTPTAPLIGDFGFSLGSPQQSIPTPLSIKVPEDKKETVTTPKPESVPSPEEAAVAEAPRPAPGPTAARKEFVEIAVELKIQDGRVAEAKVGNPQPGAEAFEATALHIARHRRYPPGTSRTETVVLRVANQFGKKEP